MKRLSALVLSLLLFWVQVFVLAQPVKADAPAICTCCACQRTDCCVTPSAPERAPLPAATAPIGSQSLHSFSAPAALAWLLPHHAAGFVSAAPSPSPLAARVPLFRRDCALLI